MRLAPLIAVAAACGFAPQDSLTGRRIGDGVAPWQDLGPVELCLGTQRIGPPGSQLGGLCAPTSAPPPAACGADEDCRSREACVCGRCTVKFCTSNGECRGGRVCSFTEKRCDLPCAIDDDCATGETCSSPTGGVCRARCTDTGDCQTGEVCAMQGGVRRCIAAACELDPDCQGGEVCNPQREPREIAEPTVLAEDGDLVMWVEMSHRNPDERAIWRATSRDGRLFHLDPAQPVLEDAGDAHAPSVVVVDGSGGAEHVLYYEKTGGIARSASPGGDAFDPGSVVLAGDWHAPAAVVAGGETLVFVQEGAGDGVSLWRGAGAPEPVYRPADVLDPDLWRAVTRVGSPFAAVETGVTGEPTVRLWFDAFGQESDDAIVFGEVQAIPPNDSIGFASAPLADPAALATYPWNPVFDRVVAFLEHRSERAPAVVRVPGEEAYYLYYAGFDAPGVEQDGLGVAQNPPRE